MTRPLVALVLVGLVVTLAAGCGQTTSTPTASPKPPGTRASAEVFLHDYVAADGRVIRHDQGGDTVSEGQAYGMLLDVAVGDRTQFGAIWDWSKANLEQSDGLLAYHWANGRVADRNAASDADLDVARALVLAGSKWHDPTWTAQGRAYAAAILANETVEAGGRLWLVAGPWARTSPYYLDPSYLDPATFELLGRVTGDSRWTQIRTSSAAAVAADTDHGTVLPSDWAEISPAGVVSAAPPPGGGAVVYGYDAFRTLVREADDCASTSTTRRTDARLLPLATRTASSADLADTYERTGVPAQPGRNPLTLVAAAGAARAAGRSDLAERDLDRAAADEAQQPSYYLDAWVPLARYLLTTDALSGCTTS